MRRGLHVTLLIRACIALVLAVGCSTGPSETGGADDRTVTVFAAASLTDVLRDIADAFEEANPSIEVDLSFDGSATLAAQLTEGAPADVFAAADEQTMGLVVSNAGVRDEPVVFARNELQIVVAEGNPHGVESLAQLHGDVVVALCRPDVPCGAYAERAFQRAGLTWPSAAEESSVRAVLTKVQLGEADAGIVYRTDVRRADGVDGVDLPAAVQVAATYPAAVLSDADHPAAADDFVAFLLSRRAQELLTAAGFSSP
ncbi:MAG: molybdate ABC transporter substrate-binding protein [Actinomycetota bacterium]